MTDPRTPAFDGIRTSLGRSLTGSDVTAIHGLLDTLGAARDGRVTVAVLRAACPERSAAELAPWVEPINEACARYGMVTNRQVAAFVSQMAHESGMIAGRREAMGYSADRMAAVWPSRYAIDPKADVKRPNALAKSLAGKSEAIANNVYANRLGNGNTASGDGWRFRGVGPGQLTGRDNLTRFGRTVGMTAEQAVEYAATVEGGVASFAWFWSENDINRLAETPGVEDETRKINGGTIGLADRKARFERTLEALNG